MNFQFHCPECRDRLDTFENKLHCSKCLQDYVREGNYTVFVDHHFPVKTESRTEINDLITEIDNSDYESAVEKFKILNPGFEPFLTNTQFDKSADSIFHGLGRNTSRCLEIKSELGNRSEILSNIFRQVYSIEYDDEYVELQKRRFKGKNCNNISITKCDLLKLPFPDNFFDLVLCNGVLENIANFVKTHSPYEAQKRLILELKRVISESGCIIFGVENKHGFKIGDIVNTSWLPLDEFENKHGFKIRADSNKKNDKVLLKHGFSKYRSILESSGLAVKPYWVLTSYNRPHYSGSLYDEITIKWLFRNLDVLFGKKILTKKIELILSLFKKLNYPFAKTLMQFFSPYFVFCCSKTSRSESLEDWIKENTKYQNLFRWGLRLKNMFILLNTKGEAEKVVYVKRYGYDFLDKIEFFEQKLPNVKEPSKRIWMTNWLNGRPVNPQNENEVLKAIDWLIEFQKNTKQERMNKEDAIIETSLIKKGLEYVPHEDINHYYKWLDEYEKHISKNPFYKTAVHGNFGARNVLFDPKTRKINVIDWEHSREKGNPCYDFLRFLFYVITNTSATPLPRSNALQRFKEYLEGQGEINNITPQIESKINTHFGFRLDFKVLLRFLFLKGMVQDVKEIMNTEIDYQKNTYPERGKTRNDIKTNK